MAMMMCCCCCWLLPCRFLLMSVAMEAVPLLLVHGSQQLVLCWCDFEVLMLMSPFLLPFLVMIVVQEQKEDEGHDPCFCGCRG